MDKRVPIVAILGHVDHGKTTILDYIRGAKVQSGEVGGITQKISAFTIEKESKQITFIDTPGHEAFDLMRTRGGSIADVVLLIVAANDGVMPQTEESIEIIKNSKAKPIVVINKIDLPEVNVDKIKRDIISKGILLEGLGGDVPVVLVSGKTGQGIDTLLETISLVVDVEGFVQREELNDQTKAKAYVLESVKDKSKGNISTIIVTQGELVKGMNIGYKSDDGVRVEKIKGIISEENLPIDSLSAGFGGRILGLEKLIELGSEVYVTDKKDEKLMESLLIKPVEKEEEGIKEEFDLSSLFETEGDVEKKSLNVIIKSSSEGSLEAIRKSLSKINEDGFTVNIIKDGLGDMSMQDVEMAKVSKAIVLGFEVGFEQGVVDFTVKNKILARPYDLIYKLIDEVTDAVSSLSMPAQTEEEIGAGEVKAIFTLSDGSQVVGFKITKGIFKKGGKIYVVRGDDIVLEARIESLRHLKDTITEGTVGMECGVVLSEKGEILVGDTLYCYKIIK